jgi:hypothetical protein
MRISKFTTLWQKLRYTKAYRFPCWLIRKITLLRFDSRKAYIVPMRLGLKIKLIPATRYLINTLFNRQYHDDNVFLMSQFVPQNGVVFDIGANIGLCSCCGLRS